MSIQAFSQNVGVGTSDPSDALHVIGNASDHALRVQVGGSTKFRILSNGGTTIGLNNTGGTPANGLYVHGNTGFGVNAADDRIDVNGNVDITGEIKASGQSGQDGQVLMSNGAGGMNWADSDKFQNFDDFVASGVTSLWTVPVNVTEVIFEVWGAGGGGAQAGGGGAGGYGKVKVTVTPGDVYSIFIGVGGSGATASLSPENGSASTVTGNAFATALSAGGGAKASSNFPGIGGAVVMPFVTTGYRFLGGNGSSNQYRFDQYSSTQYAEITDFGSGGDAPFIPGSGGSGVFLVLDTVTQAEIHEGKGRKARIPGGGGGGGVGTVNNKGANGYAIVRY